MCALCALYNTDTINIPTRQGRTSSDFLRATVMLPSLVDLPIVTTQHERDEANREIDRRCPICLEAFDSAAEPPDPQSTYILQPCGHPFHLRCIATTYQRQSDRRCPRCRVTATNPPPSPPPLSGLPPEVWSLLFSLQPDEEIIAGSNFYDASHWNVQNYLEFSPGVPPEQELAWRQLLQDVEGVEQVFEFVTGRPWPEEENFEEIYWMDAQDMDGESLGRALGCTVRVDRNYLERQEDDEDEDEDEDEYDDFDPFQDVVVIQREA